MVSFDDSKTASTVNTRPDRQGLYVEAKGADGKEFGPTFAAAIIHGQFHGVDGDVVIRTTKPAQAGNGNNKSDNWFQNLYADFPQGAKSTTFMLGDCIIDCVQLKEGVAKGYGDAKSKTDNERNARYMITYCRLGIPIRTYEMLTGITGCVAEVKPVDGSKYAWMVGKIQCRTPANNQMPTQEHASLKLFSLKQNDINKWEVLPIDQWYDCLKAYGIGGINPRGFASVTLRKVYKIPSASNDGTMTGSGASPFSDNNKEPEHNLRMTLQQFLVMKTTITRAPSMNEVRKNGFSGSLVNMLSILGLLGVDDDEESKGATMTKINDASKINDGFINRSRNLNLSDMSNSLNLASIRTNPAGGNTPSSHIAELALDDDDE